MHAGASVLAVLAALAATHVVLNPCNTASLGAGIWVLLLALLAPSSEDSVLEPVACLVVAAAMAFAALPTCVALGKVLLHATAPEASEAARQAVWQVQRVVGVRSCGRCLVWNTTAERFVGVLRVSLVPGCDAAAVQRQIEAIVSAGRLGDWTMEMRKAH
ncbi:hypothetical protein FBU59_007302 [Linderina macrospora]|uniref:Uncharacterized protein n=1 Tax=Linderina macrospora TaxID=4868 RepID=A0ACC1IXF3_9FUNG|nr:hypothetical protein FBU59_007302 [Linderina macrospora]